MSTGDQNDMQSRLTGLLPSGWFPKGLSPIMQALMVGGANAHAFAYSLLAYVRQQTRIATATDGFLDLIAWDFFGPNIERSTGQSDTSFRAEILANLFKPRSTRQAIIDVLEALTGFEPIIINPRYPPDTGAYGAPNIGYGVAGYYGSMLLPFQVFIIAFLPPGTGIPNVSGYGISTGGYSQASELEYASLSMITDTVTIDDVYTAILSVAPVCAIFWVRTESAVGVADSNDDVRYTEDGALRYTEDGFVRLLEQSP